MNNFTAKPAFSGASSCGGSRSVAVEIIAGLLPARIRALVVRG